MTDSPPSVLFTDPRDADAISDEQPPFFTDLNLDQVVGALTSGRKDYDLAPVFHTPIRDTATIRHRHEVFRDLEDPELVREIGAFAGRMREMRRQLAQVDKLRHPYQRETWFLDAVATYGDAVGNLADSLERLSPASAGLTAFRDFLTGYRTGDAFTESTERARSLRTRLSEIRYNLHITGSRIRVSAYQDQADYGAEVIGVFEKFQQGEAKDHRVAYRSTVDMNHVEEAVLDRVARLFPDVFAELDTYCERHRDHLDPTVVAFDREIQFYLAYLEFIAPLEDAGLPFCCPRVDDASKEEYGEGVFDLALAAKLVEDRTPVVTNHFELSGPERVIVVSGPNQGGKTTFARTFGQLHHLAALGCPVPGRRARLFLCDQLFTHFERGENLTDLSGKLHDDLIRVHDILDRATPSSVVVMNEVFTSTTLSDAVLLGTRVLKSVIDRDLLCVCVTFVDELASLGPSTVSMVSTVVPADPATRTYRVVRKPADGLAHALAIAEKYALTYRQLKERIAS
ncbi:MutS-related protein [Actinacidiphila alni]|uniref:MutS-related protein n=1 Tax=Actinacidiphila alni TaxID=380248 RepID=UPI003453D736